MKPVSHETAQRKAEIAATLESLKLSVDARFVPFSQSRNKAEKHKTLNWVMTVKRDGRDVLTTDYMAGMAHCPGHAAEKAPSKFQAHGYKMRAGSPTPALAACIAAQSRMRCFRNIATRFALQNASRAFPWKLTHGGAVMKTRSSASSRRPQSCLIRLTCFIA